MKNFRKEQHSRRAGVFLLFTIVVFAAMLLNTIISSIAAYFLVKTGVIVVEARALPHVGSIILRVALISLPIGLFLSWLISKLPLKPVRDLVSGMNRLASGDFKTRLDPGPIARYYPGISEVSESFNKMAQELDGTEMLRGDFINNFSHEFKTPIVSIAGFAKLLKRGNLSQEQQKEYLSVIEEESMRLSDMATNVLNLTKVENQTILTDMSRYNLSEQVRSCILLLERKWDKKGLDFSLQFEEQMIQANEELMKQVWINLLDNAIKFSSAGETIELRIDEWEQMLAISISNYGETIPKEKQTKIFHKFYQADESHATEGNGVGLAIVKRIVELHSGEVRVHSENGKTTFSVYLPKE